MISDGTSSKRHSAFLPKIAFQSCVPYRSARPIFFIFFLSPSRSLSIVLIIAISWYPKLLIPRENSRHRQVETDRRETSKCPRTQRRYAIISLTLDSPVRLVSANLIIRDQVRRIPLHLRLFNRTEARRTIERERERRDPVSPGHTDTRGHVRMWVPYIYNLSTYWALRFGGPPRLDLRLFNSSACQKHQCTLCSPIVLPFFLPPTPLSPLPFFLPLSAHPLCALPSALFLFSLASTPTPSTRTRPSSFLLHPVSLSPCVHTPPSHPSYIVYHRQGGGTIRSNTLR